MIVLHDPETLKHETVELLGAKTIPALESPARITSILESIQASSHRVKVINLPEQDDEAWTRLLCLIKRKHDSDYLHHLDTAFDAWRTAGLIEQTQSILPECFVFTNSANAKAKPPKDIYARAGYFAFDMSSGIMEKTYSSVMASANLAHRATQQLFTSNISDIKSVLALCRPPGHHCDGRRAGGYCYINNAAVAVSTWREQRPEARVGILDIDFHHGNGTQEIFYDDGNVLYTSIHGEDEFPYYTGYACETGGGNAVGSNFNVPLTTGSSFEDYTKALHQVLSKLNEFKLEFLVVSLGFDTFCLDPLGNFKIETEDYEIIARTVRNEIPNTPAVILLEGGYVLEHLGPNMLSFLKGWEGTERVNMSLDSSFRRLLEQR